MMNYCTYSMRDEINHVDYYGHSADVTHRWTTHFCNLRARRHPNKFLQEVFDLEGEVFTLHVLDTFDTKDEAREAETALIKADPTSYNILHNEARQ